MALNTNVSKTPAKAALDAVVDSLDTGTGANARLQIYDGTQPASPDVAVGTQTKLAEIDLGAAAVFSAATTGTGGSASSATANASAILPKSDTSATGHATKTAAWARGINKGGVAKLDGEVATSGADFTIDSTSINVGQTVTLNSWKVKLPFK